MKLTDLMLSACVAALTLASCNKDGYTPDVNTGMKSIEISINNSVFTKGDAGSKLEQDSPVQLNDLRIYLTDDTYSTFYEAYQADGTTPVNAYWSATTTETITQVMDAGKISFHYVSPAVTKVIAVGNMGATAYTDINTLKAAVLKVEEQQDQTTLGLYGEGPVTGPSGTHTDVDVLNNIYTVDVTLKPRISRFEVDGFRVKFNTTPKYSTIEVLQIAFDDYMPQTVFYTGEDTGTIVDELTTTQLAVSNSSVVYSWLAGNTNTGIWWYDTYAPGAVSLTSSSPVKDVAPRAYHFFAGTQQPQFIIHLTADGVPAYIYTKKFWNTDNPTEEIKEFKEGYIYRMGAAGEVEADGAVEIPEDKIDEMDRCLDISVTVEPWVVTLVTPEF